VVDYLALLEAEVVAMAAALGAADPDAAVTSCPGWTVRDLAAHVTNVHRWALAALDGTSPPEYDERLPAGPLDEPYAAAAQALLDGLRSRPDDAPAWTFDRHNRTVGFWKRRQLHEIAVHRWDVAPYELDPAVAEDGIDEVLDFFLPRQIASGRTVAPEGTLRLVSPDRTWDFGAGRPVTTAEGPAGSLALALWRRGSIDLGAWTGLTP
jgi:uncharacterized protein (TIGR03083 family)